VLVQVARIKSTVNQWGYLSLSWGITMWLLTVKK